MNFSMKKMQKISKQVEVKLIKFTINEIQFGLLS